MQLSGCVLAAVRVPPAVNQPVYFKQSACTRRPAECSPTHTHQRHRRACRSFKRPNKPRPSSKVCRRHGQLQPRTQSRYRLLLAHFSTSDRRLACCEVPALTVRWVTYHAPPAEGHVTCAHRSMCCSLAAITHRGCALRQSMKRGMCCSGECSMRMSSHHVLLLVGWR